MSSVWKWFGTMIPLSEVYNWSSRSLVLLLNLPNVSSLRPIGITWEPLSIVVISFQTCPSWSKPKFSTSLKVQAKLHRAIETQTLDSDEAGKLRGDLNWMFSMCAGHLGRFAGPVLQLHQSADAFCLSESSLRTLQLLLGAVTHATPRVISLVPHGRNLTRIYSDASFENGELRLGWVIFPPSGRPDKGTCVVPPPVLASWKERTQQIFPGESLAGLVVPLLHPDLFYQSECFLVHRQ